ncbi:MAG: hypothetical protein GSR73_01575 [Desulfurococcales archaeon]|nr:hypothetical protein [Desulfurococcales archaeon]
MAKKKEKTGGQQESKGQKELKIISVQVVTPEAVMKNPRQIGLLYIIDKLGPTHEKTLQHIVYLIQEELDIGLGYDFRKVGDTPYSPQLKSDLVALLYVGFIETEPGLYRKLRTTSSGKDALEKAQPPAGLVEAIQSNFEKLRNKASILDSELDLEIRKRMRGLGARRRRYF